MAVAQLVESRIVIPVVVGSSPISHPKFKSLLIFNRLFLFESTRSARERTTYPYCARKLFFITVLQSGNFFNRAVARVSIAALSLILLQPISVTER